MLRGARVWVVTYKDVWSRIIRRTYGSANRQGWAGELNTEGTSVIPLWRTYVRRGARQGRIPEWPQCRAKWCWWVGGFARRHGENTRNWTFQPLVPSSRPSFVSLIVRNAPLSRPTPRRSARNARTKRPTPPHPLSTTLVFFVPPPLFALSRSIRWRLPLALPPLLQCFSRHLSKRPVECRRRQARLNSSITLTKQFVDAQSVGSRY